MRKVDDCQNQEHPKSRKKKGQICYVSIEWEFRKSRPQKGASLHFFGWEVDLWTAIALYSNDRVKKMLRDWDIGKPIEQLKQLK
jgi:hypothetical protein